MDSKEYTWPQILCFMSMDLPAFGHIRLITARLILAEARSTEVDTIAHWVPWEEHDPRC